jgi:Helix-turn-helix domain
MAGSDHSRALLDAKSFMAAGRLSLEEGAAFLGVSPYTLRAWSVYQNRIPFFRLGRKLVFDVLDLQRFLTANRVEAK